MTWGANDPVAEEPAAAPVAWGANDKVVEQPPLTLDPVGEKLLDKSPVGRVLDAFGQGAKDVWGTDRLGINDDTAAEMRKLGLFPDFEGGIKNSLKSFNEAFMRPAAVALDTVLRAPMAVAGGVAGAVGQIATELGEDPAMGKRLSRDTFALAETLGITTATNVGLKPRDTAGRVAENKVADTTQRMAADAGKPEAVFQEVPQGAVVDKAGNINLDRIAAGEDVKQVIREAAVTGNEFTAARRGEMSLPETEALAEAIGMTPAELGKRKVGEAFNAEEAVAARNLLVQSATSVRDLAAKAHGGADTDVLAFQEAMTKHMAIQEQVAGMTAEAGRALSSFRTLAQATGEARDLGKVIEQMGGRGSIEDIARKIGELDTPQQISQFLMDSRKAKTSDQLLELWINGLLSGPQTHVTNVLSNSLVAMWAVPETALASAVGGTRRAMGYGTAEQVLPGEVGARAFGFIQGAKDGIVAGWHAYKTEIPSDPVTKLEQARPRAIPSTKVTVGGKDFEIGGKQVRIPGRMLMAEDEFFKAIGYRQEINALAYRTAAKEGLEGEAFAARVAELTNRPTEAFIAKAKATADYQTFTKELGPGGKAVMQFANSHPAVRVVIPFIRTPLNILKFAGERTALSVFSPEVRATLKGEKGQIAQDTQMARIIMGSSVGAAAVGLAAEGLLTGGGPADPKERAVMYLNGWQPYSVKVGDFYYSYGRFEPLGTLLGTAADMFEVGKRMTDPEAEHVAAMVAMSVSKNLISKSWLQGPSDVVKGVSDPERYGERLIQKLVGSAVPTAVAQAAREDDPYLRDARSVLDSIKTRIPGQSEGVALRRDIWGEPIKREGSLGPDMLSPIYETRIKSDPVNQELLALKIWPAPLDRKINGVALTADQFDEYQRVAGRLAKSQLDQVVGLEGWGDLPAFARTDAIKKVISGSRQTAREYMMATHTQLITDALDVKLKQFAK